MLLQTKIHTNIHHAIIEALQLTGIASITASYSGSGDSGDSFDIVMNDENGNQISEKKEVTVLYMDKYQEWDSESKSYKSGVKEKCADLKSAIEDACWSAVSASGEDGWENNGGGHGEYTVTASGEATLSHTNCVENINSSDTQDFDKSHEVFSNAIERISNLLTLNQVESIQIDYEGEGDSGSVSDITLEGNTEFDPDETYLESYPVEKSAYENGKWASNTSLESVTVATALEDLLWKVIDHFGYGGFENNEGGSGHLIVNSDGTCEYHHNDNWEELDTNVYDLLGSETEEEAEVL